MQAKALDVSQSTILVVDDQPDIHHELASALKEYGYIVKATGDCSEALLTVQSYPPDLILLNIFMSQVSGGEFYSVLKSAAIAKNIPIRPLAN